MDRSTGIILNPDPTYPGDWIDYNDTAGVDPTDPGDWIDYNDTAGVDPTDPGDWIDYKYRWSRPNRSG